MKTSFRYVIFLLALGLLSLCYDYPDVLLKRPQSVHNWRQCDGASLALSYYQNGMHFFQPQTQGLYSDNFTTGFTAPSEIPLLYYFVALLYSIFGYHEVIFRAVNLLLFLLGLFYIFRLGLEVTQNLFYSLFVAALIFSSPLLVYYGNNFLPNTVALSFSIIGWYHFYRYWHNEKTLTFILAILFFGIAGAMKVTELTGPIIVLCLLLMGRLGIMQIRAGAHRHFYPKLAALALVFVTVTGWILYAKAYNNLHSSAQFSTFTFPFWDVDGEAVALVFKKMRTLWFTDYFYPPTLYLLGAGMVLIPVFRKRADRMLALSSLALLAAILGFSLLWFAALGDHDYFFIGFYVLPVLVFVNMVKILLSFHISKTATRIIQTGIAVFLLMNVMHAQERHQLRYNTWMNDYPQMKDFYTASPWLRQNGIQEGDTVVFYSSLNIRPLYLMNLRGWTLRYYDVIPEKVHATDSMNMAHYSNHGARYLIIHDTAGISLRRQLLPYTSDLQDQYGKLFIYRMQTKPPGP